jgi:hypothetical protein
MTLVMDICLSDVAFQCVIVVIRAQITLIVGRLRDVGVALVGDPGGQLVEVHDAASGGSGSVSISPTQPLSAAKSMWTASRLPITLAFVCVLFSYCNII